MIGRRLVAQLAHLAQHRDVPAGLVRQHRQRRAHRRRVGVVALVDHQRLAARDRARNRAPRPGSPPSSASASPASPRSPPDRIDRRQHRQRVRHPVRARLRQREAQLALADPRGDEACRRSPTASSRSRARRRPRRCPNVTIRAACGAAAAISRSRCGLSNGTIAVPPGSSPWKISPLASAIAAFVGEELGMRRRDRGDDRDVRADQPRSAAASSPAWFIPISNTPNRASRRHPREAERHAGMVVVALDRAMHRARRAAVERGEQRLLGRWSCRPIR